MATYRYTAEDFQGRPVDGHVEAASVGEARRRLEQRGLRVLEVIEAEGVSSEAPRRPLSVDEAQQFAQSVAQVSNAAIPLSPGLRAAAEESDNPRLAKAFRFLAGQLEEGRSLDDVLGSSEEFLPRYMSGLIRAAARSGQLGPALSELVDHCQAIGVLRRNIWRGLAYPLMVACLAAAVFLFILAFVAGGFEQIFGDFGMELPVLTQAVFTWRRIGVWLFPTLLLVALLMVLFVRWRVDPVVRQRWLASMPVLGPLWHHLGLVEWIGLVRVLVRNQVALLEALRLAADGVSNANVAQISRWLADGVARGRSLSQMMSSSREIPATLIPMVRWGEEAGALADSLDLGREMLKERVRMRSLWLQMAVPPLLFIAIACGAVMVVAALFLPMISLVQNLT